MRLFIERPDGETVLVEGGFTEETAKAFLKKNGHDCYLEKQERPTSNVTLSSTDPELGLEIASATETSYVAYTHPRALADGDGRRTVANYPGAQIAERIRQKRMAAAIAAWDAQRRREEEEVLAEMAAERAAAGLPLSEEDIAAAKARVPDERPLTPAEIAAEQRALQDKLAEVGGVLIPTLDNIHAQIDAAEARDRAEAQAGAAKEKS